MLHYETLDLYVLLNYYLFLSDESFTVVRIRAVVDSRSPPPILM